jgi:cytochrome P450
MSVADDVALLAPDQIRELFDLRSSHNSFTGGGYRDDPYPAWHRLRETGPVHQGTVHELTGWHEPLIFMGLPFPEHAHYSVFSYDECDAAFRDPETFASSPVPVAAVDEGRPVGIQGSMLCMGGKEHRRYRALAQPSFVPARMQWWLDLWIGRLVHTLVDRILDEGRADLNTDFCAPLPILTITASFGVPVAQALELRRALSDDSRFGTHDVVRILEPVVSARRAEPRDDLISILVEAEITDEDGARHRLSDGEVYSFAHLLLAAGSGTTWKQMGTTLTALLTHPDLLDAVRADRTLLRAAIEESLRWAPTDPMFSRFVRHDTEIAGVPVPADAIVHLCLGAANRDPARYERPDEFDPSRKQVPSLAFGDGPHICIGMHVARAEMFAAIDALLDRLPDLRLDPDAEPPRIIGMYHRGPTEIHVRFG